MEFCQTVDIRFVCTHQPEDHDHNDFTSVSTLRLQANVGKCLLALWEFLLLVFGALLCIIFTLLTHTCFVVTKMFSLWKSECTTKWLFNSNSFHN